MKPDTPALPKLRLVLVPVVTPQAFRRAGKGKIEHDVEARTPRGRLLRRWQWWEAARPRKRTARFMVLEGVRYEVEHDVAKAGD